MKIRKVVFNWVEHFIFKIKETWWLWPSIDKGEWVSVKGSGANLDFPKGFTPPNFSEIRNMLSYLVEEFTWMGKLDKEYSQWKQGFLLLSQKHYDILGLGGTFPEQPEVKSGITPDFWFVYVVGNHSSTDNYFSDFFYVTEENFRKSWTVTEKTVFTGITKWEFNATVFLKVNPSTGIKTLSKSDLNQLKYNKNTDLYIKQEDYTTYKRLIESALKKVEEEEASAPDDDLRDDPFFINAVEGVLKMKHKKDSLIDAFCEYTVMNRDVFSGVFSRSSLYWDAIWRSNSYTAATEDVTKLFDEFKYLRLNKRNVESLLETVFIYIWY